MQLRAEASSINYAFCSSVLLSDLHGYACSEEGKNMYFGHKEAVGYILCSMAWQVDSCAPYLPYLAHIDSRFKLTTFSEVSKNNRQEAASKALFVEARE